jgi:hypothetical protein
MTTICSMWTTTALGWRGSATQGGAGAVDAITTTFSHELVEACTDPDTTAAPAWRQVACTTPTQCEIGDVCSSVARIFGVQVQSYWCQSDHACVIPVPDGNDWSGVYDNWRSVGLDSLRPLLQSPPHRVTPVSSIFSWWETTAARTRHGGRLVRIGQAYLTTGAPLVRFSVRAHGYRRSLVRLTILTCSSPAMTATCTLGFCGRRLRMG